MTAVSNDLKTLKFTGSVESNKTDGPDSKLGKTGRRADFSLGLNKLGLT